MMRWVLSSFLIAVLCAFTLPNFQLTVTPPAGPVIAINGSSTPNQTVNGTTMTVSASNGPGLARDFLMVCLSGGACDGGTYASDYLNCSQSQPSTPYPTGTPTGGCTFAVPSTPSNQYYIQWQSLTTGTVIATLPFTVPSGPVSITSATVSPNSVTQNQAFSGALSATCSATCPSTASFAFTTDVTVCKTNDNAGADNNNLFTLSGSNNSTLSATAGNTSTPGTYYACIAVSMTGVTKSPLDFEVAVTVNPAVQAQITGVTVTPSSCTINSPATTCNFSGTLAAVCNVTPCPPGAIFALSNGVTGTGCSGSNPCITANGATSGSTVNAGATFTATVTNGPGNAADWVQICTLGGPPSAANCYHAPGGGYSWAFLNNCGFVPGSTGVTAGSCQLRAPITPGSYTLYFLLNNTLTSDASATFTVAAAPIPVVVQTQSNTSLVSTSPCSWTIPQAIGSGHTVMGYLHTTNSTDTAQSYPISITDNAGNTYTLSTGVQWQPYPEDIGYWYNTNITGNPTTINFNFNNGVSNTCNVGFVEYTGINSVTPIVGPTVDASTLNPSITISPSSPSWIWVFGATDTDEGSELNNSDFVILLPNFSTDGLGVWHSSAMVSGSKTLTWTNSYFNASTCGDGSATTTGCSTVMIAAALSNSGGNPSPTITVNGASSGTTVSPGASITLAVANGPGNLYDWIDLCTGGTSSCSDSDPYVFIANCSPNIPTSGATGTKSCSMTASSTAGNYTAVYRTCTQSSATACSVAASPILASAPFTVSTTSGGSPTITVNGSSTGVTVSAAASLSVAVAHGPGSPSDWISICNTGTASSANCDGAGYSWSFINGCPTHTVPGTGISSATCSLAAPSPTSTTNYTVNFLSSNGYTVLAAAPITVTGTGTGGGTQPACGSSCPAPAGYHWSLADGWDAEFYQGVNGTGVSSLGGFTNTWSPDPQGGNGSYSFGSSGITLLPDCSNGTRMELTLAPTYPTTGALTPVGTATALNYGVYEARIQQSDAHGDFWWRSNEGAAAAETDIAETIGIPSNAYVGRTTYDPINPVTVLGPQYNYPGNAGDLTASFHDYTLVWAWDGSPHGSQKTYFDGVAQDSPYNLQSSDWDYGVHQHFSTDGASGSCPKPYIINYFRYWKQMPG